MTYATLAKHAGHLVEIWVDAERKEACLECYTCSRTIVHRPSDSKEEIPGQTTIEEQLASI